MGDVRKAIQEVRNENRKKYALLIIVILIVGGTFWLRGPVNTEVVTYTNPNRLSYDLPELTKPNLILTQQRFVSATCENGNNTMGCTEPVVLSLFAQYTESNVGHYEYRVHLRMRNSGSDAFEIRPSVVFRDTGCAFIGNPFDLPAGWTSNRLDFVCPLATGPLEEQTAFLTMDYNGGGSNQAKSTIRLQ